MPQTFPSFLAAIHKKNKSIFVLAQPNVSAVRIEGEWIYRKPLTDEEIEEFELITDLQIAQKLVNEAKEAIFYKR